MATTSAPVAGKSVYVYQAPARLWHWVNALCIVILALTGYFIGKPLPSVGGEASESFLLGYIRFVHFATAQVFAVAFLGRVYWAFAGNAHARHLIFPPIFGRTFWPHAWRRLKYYLLISSREEPHAGATSLEELTIFFLFVLPAVFQILTGFALYGEGAGAGSWIAGTFGWVIPWIGDSQSVHMWHRLTMWWMVCFFVLHLYLVVREDLISRQSHLSSMISGYRMSHE